MEQNQKEIIASESMEKYLSGDNRIKSSSWHNLESENKKKKTYIVAFFVLLLILALSYLSLKSGHKSFDEKRTEIAIELPESVKSGEEVSVTFEYRNGNEVALNEASAEIVFPSGFVFESSDVELKKENNRFSLEIGNISAGSSFKARVFGRLIGNLGSDEVFMSSLQYKPANFNSKFRQSKESRVKISAVPVVLDFKVPDSIKNNSEMEISLYYRNDSDRDFSKAELRVTFPEGFSSYSSTSEIFKDEDAKNVLIFKKDDFAAGAESSVVLRGALDGDGEQAVFKAELYLLEENGEFMRYINEEKSIKLEKPDILISSKINDFDDYSAQKNEELKYKITFKNQSSGSLKGLVLEAILEGNFDLATLKAEKGNVQGNKIVWSALNVPQLGELKSGEEGIVEFSVKVKDIFVIEKKEDKNFILSVKTDINLIGSGSSGGPKLLCSETKESKVKAFIPVSVKGYFNDDGRIENFGQVPPQVGERTAYTIHWNIKNLFNDTEKIRVKSVLPEGVEPTGKYINTKGDVFENIYYIKDGEVESFEGQKEEKIYYNPVSREVTWFIPSLKANDGILTSTKEIVFQVVLTPEVSDVGKPANLIGAVSVYAHDLFANIDIKTDGNSLTTELLDDYSIGREESLVIGPGE